MAHILSRRILVLVLLLGWLSGLVPPVAAGAVSPRQQGQATGSDFQPVVIQSDRHDISPPLRSITPQPVMPGADREIPNYSLPHPLGEPALQPVDPSIVQNSPGVSADMPAPLINFDGVSNANNPINVYPPDTQGDIGPNHYVQWVNLSFQIWSIDRVTQTASSVYGPAAGNTLWNGFGGPCENENDGDPITLYDPFADRWFMSQFAIPATAPYYQCVAVSRTSDPTDVWYRYQFVWPGNKLNDYSKFGVWPDAYYMTTNQFNSTGTAYLGVGVAALDRNKMLSGQPATMVYFDLDTVNPYFYSMLPADFDGLPGTPPPSGAPGFFSEWDDSTWLGDPSDMLRLWEFHVDWVTPGNSTFGVAGQPNILIPTANVDPNMCGYSRNCIPQPGVTQKLDAISDRLMYRLQYRNFGGYQALVSNHTVDVGGDHAGIHWFELHKTGGGAWSMYQQGVYAPDVNHRWMGSLALDHVGNLALGYSVSSSTVYPSVRYAGRLTGDPLGTLPQVERELYAGSGSQTGTLGRWGDYSMMAVDPTDDCTFWYTQEYLATTGTVPWRTRIGAFKFPNCPTFQPGDLSVAPLSLQATLQLGGLISHTLQLTNTGGGPVSFKFIEDGGDFVPARPNGTGYAAGHPGVQVVAIGDSTFSVNLHPPSAPRNQQPLPDLPDAAVTLTESISQAVAAANSVACNAGGIHTNNSYLRVFDLPIFGVNDLFNVINVEVGIQQAIAGSGGSQPVTVNLYTLSGPLLWANMTLIGTASVQVADQDLTILSIPVQGTAPAGSMLVVELFTPDGQPAGHSFFVGSNSLGQTAPSYIAAANCGEVEPVDIASLGFLNMHIVMNVTGYEGIPWLREVPSDGVIPGTGLPLSEPVGIEFDAAAVAQPGVYHAQLHIDSDSLQAVPSVPVTMTVTAPPTWGKVAGIVSSLGMCNQTPSPLENAQLVIQPGAGSPVYLTTNEDGHYSYWFDQAASPLSVSATAPSHTSQTVPGVVITAGNTTPVNLLLSWLQCNYLNLPMILRGPQQ